MSKEFESEGRKWLRCPHCRSVKFIVDLLMSELRCVECGFTFMFKNVGTLDDC